MEDIATCLVKYVKFWDDWEVDCYGNANLGDLDNSTNNVLIPLDSWTSGLLVYRLPLSVVIKVMKKVGDEIGREGVVKDVNFDDVVARMQHLKGVTGGVDAGKPCMSIPTSFGESSVFSTINPSRSEPKYPMHKDGDRQGMFTSLGRTQPTSLSIPLESGPYVTPKTVPLTYINATCDNEFVVAIQGVPIDVPIDGGNIICSTLLILAVNPNISLKPNSYDNASRGVSVVINKHDATSIKSPIKLTKLVVILGVSTVSKEALIGLVDKIESGALAELARGFDYVNSDSESSSEELIRVTPGVISHIDEIVQSVSIQDKPISYVGVTGGLKPEPSKSKANFRSLFSENLCECVNFSLQRKVVETLLHELVLNCLHFRFAVIMDHLVKICKKARNLELKRRHLKNIVLTPNTSYPTRKIWRIRSCTSPDTTKTQDPIRRIQLVLSCFVIFDLEPLSLSFDFVFTSEIFKSLSFSLDHLCHLAILCLDQHAHTLHHLESLLTISLDRLDILKEDLVYQSLWKSLSLILKLS
ncbi:hypothetical protein Tco_0963913 [Tanacetum coccineum]